MKAEEFFSVRNLKRYELAMQLFAQLEEYHKQGCYLVMKPLLRPEPMSLITMILATSERIKTERSKSDVMLCITEEVGELATEVAIDKKFKKRAASPDGIVGEALDLIIGAVDMIYLALPDAVGPGHIEDILRAKAEEKLAKWEKNA